MRWATEVPSARSPSVRGAVAMTVVSMDRLVRVSALPRYLLDW